MPVVAVAVAVGATAFAAADIAVVGLTVMTALEAVSAVGAITSAVGVVTGNKSLTMAGAALGLVGGIGSLAANAGVFGADASASLFGDSAAAGSETTSAIGAPEAVTTTELPGSVGAATTPPVGADVVGNGPSLTTATGGLNPDALDPAGAINTTSLAPAEGSAAAIETSGAANAPLAAALSPPVTGAPAGAAQSGLFSMAPDAGSGLTWTGGTPETTASSGFLGIGGPSNSSPLGVASLASGPNQGILGSLMDFGKSNPLLAYGLVQSGGALISGLTNPVTPAQIDALNAQAEANRAAANIARNQATTMAMPKATVASAPITGSLINNQPSNTPLVTGAPA